MATERLKTLIAGYSAKHNREALSLDTDGITMLTTAVTVYCGLNEQVSNMYSTGKIESVDSTHETPVHLFILCSLLLGIQNFILGMA